MQPCSATMRVQRLKLLTTPSAPPVLRYISGLLFYHLPKLLSTIRAPTRAPTFRCKVSVTTHNTPGQASRLPNADLGRIDNLFYLPTCNFRAGQRPTLLVHRASYMPPLTHLLVELPSTSSVIIDEELKSLSYLRLNRGGREAFIYLRLSVSAETIKIWQPIKVSIRHYRSRRKIMKSPGTVRLKRERDF